MDEEKKPEGKEEATNDKDVGDKPESAGLIDKANSAAERLEASLKKQEELIQRQEELAAKQMLAGSTEAGGQAPKKEPETDIEYSKKVMAGEVNPLKDDGFK